MAGRSDMADRQGGCGCREGCEKVGYQYGDILVPVDLKPDARLGNVTVECCGEPVTSWERCGDSCQVVVTQRVNIRIPISYRVTASMGESTMVCGEA